MAGLYIHIPFCKQACYYCDFHFSTNLKLKSDLVKAICKEIELQKDYLETNVLESIYFGGGTPSLLSEEELQLILATIHTFFQVKEEAEITLEANPDDLDKNKLRLLKRQGINRLSIGTQSFYDPNLQFLHRVHTSQEAEKVILEAQDVGFEDLSLDLIYAIPGSDLEIWTADIDKALSLKVNHISAYCLTIEKNTVFGNWLQKNKIQEIDEEFAQQSLELLLKKLLESRFEHYEISNFAFAQKYAKHNTSYWFNQKYLGVGASSHSFNGRTRSYNVSNNVKYISSISENKIPCETEILSKNDNINEYIMTNLRTMWGCNLDKLKRKFGIDLLVYKKKEIENHIQNKFLTLKHNTLFLNTKAILLADTIIADLFFI